jgi:hypothetical protein
MNFEILKWRLKYPHKIAALKYFLRNPSLLFTLSGKPSKYYFSRTLENILDSDLTACLHNFLPGRFLDHLKEKEFADSDGVQLMLYAIVRAYKPDIVVETGVARGASSSFILCAMHENGKGHLYSIDLPPYEAYTDVTGSGGGGR